MATDRAWTVREEAGGVPLGGLDLDDLGAVVREVLGGKAAGETSRQIQNADIAQRHGSNHSFFLVVPFYKQTACQAWGGGN